MQGLSPQGDAEQAQQPPAAGKIALQQFLIVGVQVGLLVLVGDMVV